MPESSDSTAKAGRAFAPFEWMIALRYLRARRKEAFISVISLISLVGIALGVATLIIVMSVMGGFRHKFEDSLLGFNGHVIVQAVGVPLSDYDAVTARLKQVPGVTRAAPIIEGQVLATAHGYNAGIIVRGMRATDLATLKNVAESLPRGTLGRYNSEGVVVGSGLAEKLGLQPGDAITLISPQGADTPLGAMPTRKSYAVAGIFSVGNTAYDGNFAFMALDEAQAYFGDDDAVTQIEVMVTKPDDDYAMLPALAKAAGPRTRLVPWQDRNGSFLEAVQIEGNVMSLILSLITFVAALNIISGLVMLVKDKSADIAILRTMGASRGAIMRVFLISGMSIGIAGTMLGLAVGVLFCLNIETIRQGLQHLTGVTLFDSTIYFLERMPAELDPGEVTFVVLLALGFTFIATLYPSWRAARLDPVEALRYE